MPLQTFKSVYKFYEFKPHTIESLENRKIWFNKYHEFSDQNEGAVKLIDYGQDTLFQNEKIKSVLVEAITELIPNISYFEAYNIVQKKISKVGSKKYALEQFKSLFTKNKNAVSDCGVFSSAIDIDLEESSQVGNQFLWDEYAKNSTGFCIKFKFNELIESLNRLNRNVKFDHCPIIYSDKAPCIDIFSYSENSPVSILKALSRKEIQYWRESEYRIISNYNGNMNISSDAIQTIYLGSNITSENKNKLIDLLKRNFNNFDVYYMTKYSESALQMHSINTI